MQIQERERTINQDQLLFNPLGSDDVNDRQIFGGNTTNVIDLNSIKYSWALEIYKLMRENFWIPEKIDLTGDVTCYNAMSEAEQRAYDYNLGFLIFLDSIQVSNLPHIVKHVTAPEVKVCLEEQGSQEGMHTIAYRHMLQTIVPKNKRNYIANLWKQDNVLKKRCEAIAAVYQLAVDNPSPKNLFKSLVANYVLESLLFYQGFVFFYSLASRHLMQCTADMFKLINKDELSHVRLFQYILREGQREGSIQWDSTFVYDYFKQAADQEIEWNKYVLGDNILGITPQSIEDYTHYLVNIRLKAVGIPAPFVSVKNPYLHLEKISDSGGEATTKVNFFDATPLYQQSSAVEGWSEL